LAGFTFGQSLVRRLVVLAAVWILFALVVTGVVLTAQYQRAALARFELGLKEQVENLFAGTSLEDGQVIAPPFTDPRAQRVFQGRYWQISEITKDGKFKMLVPSRSLWDQVLAPPPGDPLKLEGGKYVFYDAKGPAPGERLRVAAKKTYLPGHAAPVVFMAAEDRSPLDNEATRFVATIAIALILLGGGLIAAVLLQVRIGLRPLFVLRREVAEVRAGKADALVQKYPAELEPLAAELNALVAHNRDVVERQRTHVGNLAHALKTPISVMLAEAQNHEGALGDVVRRQTEAMHGHVEHHLRRARAAARSQTQRERTPVAPVLDELARTLERIFQDKGVRIDWDADEALFFQGERQDFLEIIGNLMENAAKWSRGRVRVVGLPGGAGKLSLVVEDDGPGLPADRRAEVLKRGARLDEATPGSGLGLSIVDELARAYGGDLVLSDSRLGGLKVQLILPSADA
jgi:signal transduction histidine kinase